MYQIAILLHLLLLTYWLGGDLGVFYSSRYVLRPELSVAARTVALKIMSFLDLAPRVCLVLFLPSGVTLAATQPHGATFLSGWLVALTWAFALGWLWLAIRASTSDGLVARRLDLVARLGVVIVLLGIGGYTVLAAAPFGVTTNPKWLGAKVVLYAFAVLSGVGIRLQLRPFAAAYARLATDGSSPAVEGSLRRAIRGSEPFVFAIWACILGAAILGVVKPGANL